MAQPLQPGAQRASQNLHPSAAYTSHRLPVSASSVSLNIPHRVSLHSLGNGSRVCSSGTWTTSSGELGVLSNVDEIKDRDVFVREYNRLAKKHGVRQLVVDDFSAHQRGDVSRSEERRGWLSRIMRTSANRHSQQVPPLQPPIRHKRSVSDIAHIVHTRKCPKTLEIQDMVRLSGKSMLYLPRVYAPCSLILPTCIRATAQHLAQNAATRGLFRVSGSAKVTSTLFDYYCTAENGGREASRTVRSATLPLHIQFSVHDVASTFKRLLSALPGGILGSLALFDAFVAIHSHLNGQPEFPRTKQTKVRARLMALAIGTIKSQFRRELICAVFGLLSLVGRIAEVSPREDAEGRPLPTADLMGYNALGIVFGPILVGDLLDQYTMKIATPNSGMLLFPFSPPRLRKERRKTQLFDGKAASALSVDKVFMANNITEMLISNWRDVVKQMKSLGACYRKEASTLDLSSLKSDGQDTDIAKAKNPTGFHDAMARHATITDEAETLSLDTPPKSTKNVRSGILRRAASHRLLHRMSLATLSPTKEESISSDDEQRQSEKGMDPGVNAQQDDDTVPSTKETQLHSPNSDQSSESIRITKSCVTGDKHYDSVITSGTEEKSARDEGKQKPRPNQVYVENVPPRESSKQIHSRESSKKSHSKETPNEHGSSNLPQNQADPQTIPSTSKEASPEFLEPREAQEDNPLPTKVATSNSKNEPLSSPFLSPKFTQTIRLVEPSVLNLETSPYQKRVEGEKEEMDLHSKDNVPAYSDRGTQCEDISRFMRRSSINSTPERFYREPLLSLQKDKEEEKGPSKSLGQSYQDLQITVHSPTHSSESRALSKRSSVKAMAALFESQRRHPVESDSADHTKDRCRERTSVSESSTVKFTADIFSDRLQANTNNDQQLGLERFIAHKRTDSSPGILEVNKSRLTSQEDSPRGHKTVGVPSLGTMTPYREQPPIAQHLNLTRPTSSHSASHEDASQAAEMIITPCAGRPRSATVLYSQIRKLHRQLSAKTDEAVQLKRQLEAQTDSDIGTMGEQLREAKREQSMWKDRAETAEKRVQVFEKFTEKLRDIRDVISTDVRSEDVQGEHTTRGDDSQPTNRTIDCLQGHVPQALVSSEELKRCGEVTARNSAAARLRLCLNSLPPAQDGAADDYYTDSEYGAGSCDCESSQTRKRSAQILAAAAEFLQLSIVEGGA